jgi:HPt (histidine-containing phosphotransfer) domain-containing protein
VDHQDRARRLEERFRERLRKEALQMTEMLPGIERGDLRGLSRLQAVAHRMAGAAGSFGFDEIGIRAGRLEEAILEAQDPRRGERTAGDRAADDGTFRVAAATRSLLDALANADAAR